MKKKIFICVNGIENRPADARNWNGRAVTWIHIHTDVCAEKFEYFCSALGRGWGQKKRAEHLASMIRYYINDGWEVVLIGHSNGCDVILESLGLLGWPRIEVLNLVSAACERDFNINGLNDALNRNRIGTVNVYCGGKDRALGLVARLWLARRLGYGDLGLGGPVNDDKALVAAKRINTTVWPDLDHSDCWKDYLFDATMTALTKP